MIATSVFLSYFQMSLISINFGNNIINSVQFFCANFLSIKACFELLVFNKIDVLILILIFNIQLILKIRLLNTSFDKNNVNI